nr:MAG TPA: hypothetical protein [Bacteriophage sp.]
MVEHKTEFLTFNSYYMRSTTLTISLYFMRYSNNLNL